MNLRNFSGRVLRKLCPTIYYNYKVRHFDDSTIIYKKQSYKQFLDEAFRDFRPNIDSDSRKRLEKDILIEYLKNHTRPDEYLRFKFDNINVDRKLYLTQFEKDNILISYYKGNLDDTICVLKDKFQFFKLIKEYFNRDVVAIRNENDRDKFMQMCKSHSRIFVKENNGACGVGAHIIDLSRAENPQQIFDNLITLGGGKLVG